MIRTPLKAAVIGALQRGIEPAGGGIERLPVGKHCVQVEHPRMGQRTPLPVVAIAHQELSSSDGESPVLERPVEQSAGNRRAPRVLREKMSLVAYFAAAGIVAVKVGGVVVAELDAVRKP